jgi:hypothetical protein
MTHQIGIYDHSNGEQTVREMTEEELINWESGLLVNEERKSLEEKAKLDKLAIIEELGLTEAQAIILGLLPKPTQIIS